eukprot:1157221-Pelagomonas_calceolata.AAC.5
MRHGAIDAEDGICRGMLRLNGVEQKGGVHDLRLRRRPGCGWGCVNEGSTWFEAETWAWMLRMTPF